MKYSDYAAIEEEYGCDDPKTKAAYYKLMATDLEWIVDSYEIDIWGDGIFTLKTRDDLTTQELIDFHKFFCSLDCHFTLHGANLLKVHAY